MKKFIRRLRFMSPTPAAVLLILFPIHLKKKSKMPTRKNPATSLDAWKQVHPDMQEAHYEKILSALSELKTASAEQISSRITIDYWQVSRRLSELERKQLIYKPGLKVATRTGRSAFVWALCKPGETPQKTTESALPGKSISDYSKEISKSYVQPNLF